MIFFKLIHFAILLVPRRVTDGFAVGVVALAALRSCSKDERRVHPAQGPGDETSATK